jgi:hypothetical protein
MRRKVQLCNECSVALPRQGRARTRFPGLGNIFTPCDLHTFKARILVGTNCRHVRILVAPVFTSVTIFVTIVRARVLIKGKIVKIEVTRIRTNDNNQRRENVPRKYTVDNNQRRAKLSMRLHSRI